MDRERYEILDVIGSGGMATVWRARDRRLGRLVAVKRPHPMPDGSDVHARFAREARTAATVSHPNLVPVYDSGEDEDGPFIVMAYVDGPSLATARIPRERAASIGAEVAAGLAALHAAGVVHGDVKPGNILLADGRAQLTDFGIARSLDETAITSAGMGFGTPAYAAPETRRDGTHTPASDVYSLAAVVYELSTGARWSHDLTATAPMPGGQLATALAPALSEDPSTRPSAANLAATLGGATTPPAPTSSASATVPLPDRPPTRTARAPLAAAAVIGVALLIGAAVLIARDRNGDTVASSPMTTDLGAASTSPGTTPSTGGTAPPTTPTTSPRTTPTTAPPTTPSTTPPSTTPPSTTPPTTAPPTTAPPSTTPSAVTALVRLVEASAPDDLKPKEARDIVERIERATRAAEDGNDDEVEGQLRETAVRIVRDVDDADVIDRLEELLVEVAEELGVDPDEVTEPFDAERDDVERDRDDD